MLLPVGTAPSGKPQSRDQTQQTKPALTCLVALSILPTRGCFQGSVGISAGLVAPDGQGRASHGLAVPLGASPLLGEEPGPPEAPAVPLMRPDSHGPLS